MNRRDFGKAVGITAATMSAAPEILAQSATINASGIKNPNEELLLKEHGWTPQQISAWIDMRRFVKRVEDIYRAVGKEFPQIVPDAHDENTWKHGDYKIKGRIGWYGGDNFSIPYPYTPPSIMSRLDVSAFCFWRQLVRNKNTGELKHFASWGTADDCAKPVVPGQMVTIGEDVNPGMSNKEIAEFSRKSFLKLQEMCEEFYNREA